jgi:hypothetical protein
MRLLAWTWLLDAQRCAFCVGKKMTGGNASSAAGQNYFYAKEFVEGETLENLI